MRTSLLLVPAALVLALSACKPATPPANAADAPVAVAATGPSDAELLAQGEYLVRIAGCNDCHTPGWAQNGGDAPREQWLVGTNVGWSGPWGTTYAANLRMYMQSLSEEQWLKKAKSLKTRPPMPWFTVQQMNTADLRAIHANNTYPGIKS